MSISIDYLFDASVDVTAIPLCNLIVFGIFGNLMVVINTKGNCVRIKERALIASLAFADTLESLNLIFMVVSIAKLRLQHCSCSCSL